MKMERTIQRLEKEEDLEKISVIEQIKQEVLNIKVDLENPKIAIEKITKNIEEQNSEISEGDLVFIRMAVATKANFLRNLERVKGNNTIEMALADAECMGNFIKYIRKNKKDEGKIKELWQRFDEFYLSFNEQVDEEELTGKYDIRKKPENIKRGILAEIAAMNLLEETINNFEGCEKVEIEYSTPEDDVYKKIDFFLVLTLKNGEVVEIPVQVTSCDLSAPIDDPLDEREKTGLDIKRERKRLDKKIGFVLGNTIHTSETARGIEINPNYKYQKWVEDKMKKFFDENKSGVFVFVPYGEVKNNKVDPRGEETRKKCVYENGKPSRMVRDHFGKSPTIKNIEADLAQIMR